MKEIVIVCRSSHGHPFSGLMTATPKQQGFDMRRPQFHRVQFHKEMTRLRGWSVSKPRMPMDAGAMVRC